MFSNWNDRFSTEFRASNFELLNRQITIGPTDFGEVRIETYNDHDGDGQLNRANVYLGADDSRQANKMNYDTTNWKLAGNYALDNHLLTFDYELDQIEMFNLFLPHTHTENRFDEECNTSNPNGCIDAFREARPDDIYFGTTRLIVVGGHTLTSALSRNSRVFAKTTVSLVTLSSEICVT